jgi:3-deoxy-D-manno-octulosonic-acid transferase
MVTLWFVVYNIFFLPLIWFGFRFLSLFNPKIREGFKGRKKIFSDIEEWNLDNSKSKVIFHSSSLGEYQQAIPIITELEKKNFQIITTFFSPSGFKNSKTLLSDVKKTYIPFDSYSKVKRFFDALKPEMVILMRYDLWFNFLYYAQKTGVKIIIANARYDEDDIFWKVPFVKSIKKAMYGMVDKMFVIDDSDYNNYKNLMKGFKTQVIKAGDSKFERVYEASKSIKKEEVIDPKIIEGKKVFVIGSSWKDDEDIILPVLNKILKYNEEIFTFLVPHEPKETKIAAIESNISTEYPNLKSIRLSNIDNYTDENFVIVDSIGKLMSLYSIAYVAYVGGGLRTGLHNVLEPAIFNVPVFFSNEIKNSDEDEILVEKGCGILVSTRNQFYKDFKRILNDESFYNVSSEGCKYVFGDTLGTTKKIIENIIN